MDKITVIIETSAISIALIVFGIIILIWTDFSEAIKLIGQGRFILGSLSILLGILILIINRFESSDLNLKN